MTSVCVLLMCKDLVKRSQGVGQQLSFDMYVASRQHLSTCPQMVVCFPQQTNTQYTVVRDSNMLASFEQRLTGMYSTRRLYEVQRNTTFRCTSRISLPRVHDDSYSIWCLLLPFRKIVSELAQI